MYTAQGIVKPKRLEFDKKIKQIITENLWRVPLREGMELPLVIP